MLYGLSNHPHVAQTSRFQLLKMADLSTKVSENSFHVKINKKRLPTEVKLCHCSLNAYYIIIFYYCAKP